jgi:endoglucanase
VHKYLDSDNSGTHDECVTNNIADAFEPLATWLRTNKRQALNTETGGGNVASCITYLCEQVAYLKFGTLSHETELNLADLLS